MCETFAQVQAMLEARQPRPYIDCDPPEDVIPRIPTKVPTETEEGRSDLPPIDRVKVGDLQTKWWPGC